jgi:hypothetical protein
VAGSIEAVAVMGQPEGSIAVMMLHPSASDRTPRDWFLVFREGGCESSAAKRNWNMLAWRYGGVEAYFRSKPLVIDNKAGLRYIRRCLYLYTLREHRVSALVFFLVVCLVVHMLS